MKNCKRCGDFTILKNSGFCLDCVKLNNKEKKAAWRAENKDKVRAQNIRSQSKCREAMAANTKKWRLKKPDYLKEWRLKNPDKNKLYQKKLKEQKKQAALDKKTAQALEKAKIVEYIALVLENILASQ